jgi:hypothetical protein
MSRLPIRSPALLGHALTALAFLLALTSAALMAASPRLLADALAPLVLGFICFIAGTALGLISATTTVSTNDTHSDSATVSLEGDPDSPQTWDSNEELQESPRHA